MTRPQRTTLALWSLGIVLTQSAGLTTVTALLALVLGQAEPAVRERLRTWCAASPRPLHYDTPPPRCLPNSIKRADFRLLRFYPYPYYTPTIDDSGAGPAPAPE